MTVNPYRDSDLHWADQASLAVVGRLLPRAPSLGVPLVLAGRPSTRTEVADVLAEARALGAHTAQLDPLTPEESLALVADELGAQPGPTLSELVDGAAGNPFFIVELARSLRAGDDLVHDGGTVEARSRQLPASLRDRVARAVNVLHESTQAALRAAAILGTRIDLTALASFSAACTAKPPPSSPTPSPPPRTSTPPAPRTALPSSTV